MNTLILFPFQLNIRYIEHSNIKFDDVMIMDHISFYKRHPYHKKRIALHRSAIMHFIDEHQHTYPIKHVWIESLDRFYNTYNHPHTYMYLPNDQQDVNFIKPLDHIHLLDDPLYIVSREEWKQLLSKKPWKMDTIYRQLRMKHHILMDGDMPLGGKYSFDGDNRKPFKKGLQFHEPITFESDDITTSAIDWTNALFSDHPGTLDHLQVPVNRTQALQSLDHFIYYRLASFGDHQDVMMIGQPFMSHALLSSSLNLGLITPKEVIDKAVKAYHEGLCEFHHVEGFIRQILGWREYIRGVYLHTPDYHMKNAFHHHVPLPSFYWNAKTELSCLSHTIHETIEYSYNHHIQRLMILSNYANLIGVNPIELNDWFNSMYMDAFDWVVTPNVIGMGLYADGGLMSTKPYISGASYINKMSNYCESCKYDPTIKTGEKACPFNALYWHFIDNHQETLRKNPRMSMIVNLHDKMNPELKEHYRSEALTHIDNTKKIIASDIL